MTKKKNGCEKERCAGGKGNLATSRKKRMLIRLSGRFCARRDFVARSVVAEGEGKGEGKGKPSLISQEHVKSWRSQRKTFSSRKKAGRGRGGGKDGDILLILTRLKRIKAPETNPLKNSFCCFTTTVLWPKKGTLEKKKEGQAGFSNVKGRIGTNFV